MMKKFTVMFWVNVALIAIMFVVSSWFIVSCSSWISSGEAGKDIGGFIGDIEEGRKNSSND